MSLPHEPLNATEAGTFSRTSAVSSLYRRNDEGIGWRDNQRYQLGTFDSWGATYLRHARRAGVVGFSCAEQALVVALYALR